MTMHLEREEYCQLVVLGVAVFISVLICAQVQKFIFSQVPTL